MTDLISIVICARDEEKSLGELIPGLQEVVNSDDRPFEVIIVDDHSSDGTADLIAKHQKNFPELLFIQLPYHGGQTGCFKEAFREARGGHIIRMDADLQDDPRDLPKFLERIDEGSELIIGLRECRKHGRFMRFAGAVYDLIVLALFDTPLHSSTGSYVGFKASLVKDILFRKNDHRYLPLIAIHRGAQNISEVIVRHNERKFGASNYNAFWKLVLGVPEVLFFLLRLYFGRYDVKSGK